jgi:Uma2 family endonuclease
MQSPPKQLMTVDEFLPWAVAQERSRYELHDRRVVARAPENAAHWKVKSAVYAALVEAIRRAGLTCHPVPSGAAVRVSPRTAFEPDALVYCGDEVPNDALEVPNPVIVVEVLSPGTEATDMRDKLHGYFTLPSVHHYLIVDPDKRMVIHHARGSGDALQTRLLTSGAVMLAPLGLSVETCAFFE